MQRRNRTPEWLVNASNPADGTRPLTGSGWGVSITPAQDAYGANYANFGVLSSTEDIYEWSIGIQNVGVAGSSRVGMIKIGMDLAGGTSFTDFLVDLCVGSPITQITIPGAETITAWRFRKRIPAGASIGIKGAVHSATLTAFRGYLFNAVGKSRFQSLAQTHEYCDTFGASIANCQGTTITPGGASEGAWTEIGTLSRRLDWFEYSLALDTATASVQMLHVDIAIGDATNKRVIIANHQTAYNAAESSWRGGPAGVAAMANSGDKIYARAQNSIANDAGTYSVMVVGCGG